MRGVGHHEGLHVRVTSRSRPLDVSRKPWVVVSLSKASIEGASIHRLHLTETILNFELIFFHFLMFCFQNRGYIPVVLLAVAVLQATRRTPDGVVR